MDQLIERIKELQPVSHASSDRVRVTQTAYYEATETAYRNLVQLHAAEHELLIMLNNEYKTLRDVLQRLTPAAPLAPVAEEPEDPVVTVAEAKVAETKSAN